MLKTLIFTTALTMLASHAMAGSYKKMCVASLDGKRSYVMGKCDAYVEEPDEFSCKFKTRPPAVCFVENGCFVCN